MNKHEIREALFQLNIPALLRLMNSAVTKGLTPDDIMLVCIHVDDPAWTELAEHLMPGHDWQQYRDKNQKPVARGSVHKQGMVEMLSETVPGVSAAFDEVLPEGCFHVAVMDAGGASIFFLGNPNKRSEQ